MDAISQLYSQLVNAIIRPPRFEYSIEDLGPAEFNIGRRRYKRDDFELENSRKLTLQCSLYYPTKRPQKLPCVIYCHGNSGCRLDAQDVVRILLPMNIQVMCFDFAGCGLSTGEYVSLGHYEKGDLTTIVNHLRSKDLVTRIALWGRSMGAVTSIMYGATDPSIACMIVDSPFSSLKVLSNELVDRMQSKIPSLMIKLGYKMIRSSVKKAAKFDIDHLETAKAASSCFIPALFAHGLDDDFIAPSHSQTLVKVYSGYNNLVQFDGDHNSRRPGFFFDSASIFLRNHLLDAADFDAKSGNLLPAGERFDDYFSHSDSLDMDELDSLKLQSMLVDTYYSKRSEPLFAPHSADDEDEQLRQAILLSLQDTFDYEEDEETDGNGDSSDVMNDERKTTGDTSTTSIAVASTTGPTASPTSGHGKSGRSSRRTIIVDSDDDDSGDDEDGSETVSPSSSPSDKSISSSSASSNKKSTDSPNSRSSNTAKKHKKEKEKEKEKSKSKSKDKAKDKAKEKGKEKEKEKENSKSKEKEKSKSSKTK